MDKFNKDKNEVYKRCDMILTHIYNKPSKPIKILPYDVFSKNAIRLLKKYKLISTDNSEQTHDEQIYSITIRGRKAKRSGSKFWLRNHQNKLANEPYWNALKSNASLIISAIATIISMLTWLFH